jgi:hypothetical protein
MLDPSKEISAPADRMLQRELRRIGKWRLPSVWAAVTSSDFTEDFLTIESKFDDDALRSWNPQKMRLIITTVAAVCLGAHALLGCCWSHFGSGGCCKEVAASTLVDHTCETDSCHHHSDGQHPDEPCPCKCDCRATCNYLPTAKTVDCEQLGLTGCLVFLPAPNTSAEFAYFVESRDLARSAPTAALPLRLHLWNQTLLI